VKPDMDDATRERREAAMRELTEQRDNYRKKEGISKGRRGLLIVNTGKGKGKTTAALGLMLRAHGRGLRVKMFQFLKHDTAKFGEHRTLDMLEIPYQGLGDGPVSGEVVLAPEPVVVDPRGMWHTVIYCG